MEKKLWYNTSAKEWIEGLPIGNGRLAAMIWGDEETDRVSLNHEWLWRGVHRFRDNEQVSGHLEEVRERIRKGDFFKASGLANIWFGGTGCISGLPKRVDPYQPAGDLCFELSGSIGFIKRELDIEAAVASAVRNTGKAQVQSQFIAHPDHQLIMCRWSSENGYFSGKFFYNRSADPEAYEKCKYSDEGIEYTCSFNGGIDFKTRVSLRTDGSVIIENDSLGICEATWIMAYIDIGTSVKGIEQELNSHTIPADGWDALLKGHTKAFSQLLGRLALEVDVPSSDEPTDKRIDNVRSGKEDPALVLLYFNYGRYLLASSSIAGELPANLQGKWNYDLDPPWQSDYHFNINLQMNYWMAEASDMPECAEALIRYIERFIPHAKKAAKDLYGCRGIYLPLQTDAWGRSTPESYGCAVWIGAAPWIAQHIWWHYSYSGDKAFLKDRAYPIFREIAYFYEDYLEQDEKGTYQILPSQSPENKFEGTGHWPVSIGISSGMDVQLAYDALGYAIKASEILGTDEKERQKWVRIRENLPKFRVGSDGRLLEWDKERIEIEPGHRHMSHLYGLHPSDIFNPAERPEQYNAAIHSLEYRLKQGGGHTGWSRAWTACMYARIGDGAQAWSHMYALLTDFATVSLLDLHPPRIFQIDGNLGAVEAVIQCLVQYWAGKVHLIRALPPQWKKGAFTGAKVPGGHTININWSEGVLTSVEIILGYGEEIILSGLDDRYTLPEDANISDDDICIRGKEGAVFLLNLV